MSPSARSARPSRSSSSVLEEHGAMEYSIVVAATASEPAPMQYLAPYAGLRHGRIFPRQRDARADHLRRPLQAGGRLSPDVAAAAPPAGPRGLPGRRVLPALPPAGARGEAERRQRRGLPDRPADDRDPGGRRLGLHPDQRDLDHRRADLPGDRPLLQGRAPGRERRPLGVARRLRGPDQGDEVGRGRDQARARAVPGDGGLRAVRFGPRRRDPAPAEPRRAPRRAAQAGPVFSR